MAVRANGIVLEKDFAAFRTTGHFVCYLHTAVRAGRCFVADLVSAFRTFYD